MFALAGVTATVVLPPLKEYEIELEPGVLLPVAINLPVGFAPVTAAKPVAMATESVRVVVV